MLRSSIWDATATRRYGSRREEPLSSNGTPRPASHFSAYVCFTQMHPPLIHHPEFTVSGGGVYSDTLAELDYRTGQVLDAIDQAGISENTIVALEQRQPCGTIDVDGRLKRAVKSQFRIGFEGGRHAPAIVRWPSRCRPEQNVELFTAVDWLPTRASLVGQSKRVPADRRIDGVNASAFLLGQCPTSRTRSCHRLWVRCAHVKSVKWRTMKVVFRYSESTSGPIIKPQWPLPLDLVDDRQHEESIWSRSV